MGGNGLEIYRDFRESYGGVVGGESKATGTQSEGFRRGSTDTAEEAAQIQRKSREANKAYFDSHQRRRPEKPHLAIELGDHVLLHDTRLDQSHSHRLHDWWVGPYRITDVSRKKERGTYQLAELDGVVLEGYFPGDRLKKFTARVKLG